MDVRSKLQRNTENKMFTSLEAEQVQLDILGQQNKTKLEVGTIIMHVHVHVGSLHNNFSASSLYVNVNVLSGFSCVFCNFTVNTEIGMPINVLAIHYHHNIVTTVHVHVG